MRRFRPGVLWGWAGADGLPVGKTPAGLRRSLDGDTDRVRDPATGRSIGFRRGFAAEVRVPAAVWEQHGPAVVAAAPVEVAALARMSPYRFREGKWAWRVAGAAIGGANCTLPAWAFDRLDRRAITVAVYPTREAAEEALSAAILAFCRGEPAW